MSYFDTEITLNIRVYYSATKGHPQTRDEQMEPGSAEIENIKAWERVENKTDEYPNHVTMLHDLPDAVIELIEEENDLEEQALESARDEAQGLLIDAAEAKMDAIKHGDY